MSTSVGERVGSRRSARREASARSDGSARPRWIVALEATGVAGLAALLVALALRLGAEAPAGGELVACALAIPVLALVAADLVSGIAHWACDRCLDPAWPVVGPLLVAPFREHHERPDAMTRHGLLELSGYNALALQPLHLAAWRPASAGPDAPAFALDLFLLVFAMAIALTNQVHCWAHARRAPRLVRRLQRLRLLLPPHAHAKHHRGPHDRAFCVTTGWLNPPLDRAGLFASVERAVARLAGRRAVDPPAGRPGDGLGAAGR